MSEFIYINILTFSREGAYLIYNIKMSYFDIKHFKFRFENQRKLELSISFNIILIILFLS